jgi:hypothetical protein
MWDGVAVMNGTDEIFGMRALGFGCESGLIGGLL